MRTNVEAIRLIKQAHKLAKKDTARAIRVLVQAMRHLKEINR